MKRFLIHVSTYWCGMDNTFRAMAESELDLYDIAQDLAYDNFQSYGCEADIAEEEGYDPDEMEDSDWDKLWETVDESQYYNFTIEEFEGDDEEWEEYGGEIYEDTVNLKVLPNHINNNHVHIYRWLDGCGWSIQCGIIHVESTTIEDAIIKFLEHAEHLEAVREHKGYGLIGKISTIDDKMEESHSYFY